MKKKWSREPREVFELACRLVNEQVPVSLQLGSNWVVRARVFNLYYHNNIVYLLIIRPPTLEKSQGLKAVLFKLPGYPILGFASRGIRESDRVLAVKLPLDFFQLELRKNSRVVPPDGSIATFFIQDRARVSICALENISLGGVKFVGRPTHHVKVNDMIGPCTLSLAGRDSLISREVTVNSSLVTRVSKESYQAGTKGYGIKFDLRGQEKVDLDKHIDFISNM